MNQEDNTPHEYYIFHNNQLLVQHKGDSYSVPLIIDASPLKSCQMMDFIWLDGECCKAVDFVPETCSISGEWIPLRQCFGKISLTQYRRAGKAAELLDWNRHTRYCGYCGTEQKLKTIISKYCPTCDRETWAKLSPAIIVLIEKGDEVLLVQSRTFKRDYYGLVAGFVEMGENLEEALRREIMEETHLKVKNIRYFSSQSWPFPRNLMVGFFAEYESGELQLQDEELKKGGWFRYDALPPIPEKLSIARQLIDAWLETKVTPSSL